MTRAAARTLYAKVCLRRAGPWELPRIIRTAMASWQFDQATTLLGQAQAAVAKRSEVSERLTAAGLTAPQGMEDAFEGTGGPAAATQIGDDELTAIDAIGSAAQASGGTGGILEQIGLLGLQPGQQLTQARSDFESGDLAGAGAYAAAAQEAWAGAGGRGVQRLVLVLLIAGALLVLLVVGGLALRSRFASRGSGWLG